MKYIVTFAEIIGKRRGRSEMVSTEANTPRRSPRTMPCRSKSSEDPCFLWVGDEAPEAAAARAKLLAPALPASSVRSLKLTRDENDALDELVAPPASTATTLCDKHRPINEINIYQNSTELIWRPF